MDSDASNVSSLVNIKVKRESNPHASASAEVNSDLDTLEKQKIEMCKVEAGVLEVKLTSKENYSWRRTYKQQFKVIKQNNKITYANVYSKVSGGGFFGSSSKTYKEECYLN